MFDSPTLSVSELAERWQKTPRQILDYAQALGVPLYFMFDGLAFDLSDYWHRFNGDADQRGELGTLSAAIEEGKSRLALHSRGATDEFNSLTDQEAQELRQSIEASKRRCAVIKDALEQREISRKKMHHRGLMRAAPKTLFDIAQCGEARYTPKAFYPGTPVRVVTIPEQAMPIVDGRLMSLEPFEALPPLTIDSLCAVTAEVKAIEAYLKAKQAAPEPQPAPPTVAQATETKEQRQDRRLKACIDDGLPMDTKAALSRLPDGVGDVADREGVTRQAFSTDVKAALKRRESARREGKAVHCA